MKASFGDSGGTPGTYGSPRVFEDLVEAGLQVSKNAVAPQYSGDLLAQACRAMGVTQSMGRVGSALGNATAESFNSTLEHELLSRQRSATKADARRAVAWGGLSSINQQPSARLR